MNTCKYNGPFKQYIKDFITLKQALGYNYTSEANHLLRFDKFTAEEYSSAQSLTKDIVMEWCSKKSYERQQNLCSRASIIRQFSLYLVSIGFEAYCIPKNHFKSGQRYNPHIYTDSELTRFFHQTDCCHYCSECPQRHLIMPIFFRMLYTCGLRLSEARLLKVADIDLTTGILTINHSKKDNNRLVPMSDTLTRRCRMYSKTVHRHSKPDQYYFFFTDNRPMTKGNVYHNFRRFLRKAGISHRGRGFGPRIHDLRHSFAVHCLKKWTQQKKDLNVYLPILRVYLGHDSFYETAYYLRLTADVFPDITIKLETMYPDLIPQLSGGVYDSD